MDTESGDAVPEPAAGDTPGRRFRESDDAWARLDEIAQQQGFPPEKGRAHVIREAIRWYFAVWEGLDKVAGAQGRSRTAVLRDAVASYIAAWELERRGR